MLNVILDATAMQDVIVEMLDFVMDSQRDLDGRLGKDVWRCEWLEIELKLEKLKVEDEHNRVKAEFFNLQKIIDDERPW